MSRDTLDWVYKTFDAADFDGVRQKQGYCCDTLAMQKVIRASPRGKRPPIWSLTHLNTGHTVAHICAWEDRAFEIATEIYELIDWSFAGLHGWKNVEPQLPDMMQSIKAKYKKGVVDIRGGGGSEERARAILMSRE